MTLRHDWLLNTIYIYLLSMKKIAAFFLLGIFLFNTMGYFIVFTIVKQQVKTSVMNRIENNNSMEGLSIITIKKENLKDVDWLEDKKEMRYAGERYDIVKSEETKTTVVYYCINDKQEESLFANLYEHILNHVSGVKTKKDSASKKLIDNSELLYFSSFIFSVSDKIANSNAYSSNSTRVYSAADLFIDSPPPEFC